MTSTEMAAAAAEYRTKRTFFQSQLAAWRADLQAGVEDFTSRVTTAQISMQALFDRVLLERHGRDFARSDIAGLVFQFARYFREDATVPATERRFLLVRSDGVDCPGAKSPGGKPYRAKHLGALTEAELPPDVVLVFLNTSRLPEQSPLFRGIKNPSFHFDSFAQFLRALAPSSVGINDGVIAAATPAEPQDGLARAIGSPAAPNNNAPRLRSSSQQPQLPQQPTPANARP